MPHGTSKVVVVAVCAFSELTCRARSSYYAKTVSYVSPPFSRCFNQLFLHISSIIRYDDGKTFVVKDTERFATDVIPAYFKHNNFSSFVRQLNFYGFRKIKSGSLRIADAATSEESKYWKFRHEKFQRGRPDLLTQIRKNTSETADKQEVDQLRGEVKDLRNALMKVSDDVLKLKALVELLVKTKDVSNPALSSGIVEALSNKKRKVSGSEYPAPVPSLTPLSSDVVLPDSIGLLSDTTKETIIEDIPMAVTSEAAVIPLPVMSAESAVITSNSGVHASTEKWPGMLDISPASALSNRVESVGSTISATFDDDMLMSSLLNLGDDDDDDAAFFDNL